ncbi:hypothetical protein B0H34DRAFT_718887 [Crassisporium funariophilum]|nr:hypothetical protein B0H34DRAFT_718887 [Crassisporium funariophilum]
MLLCVGILIFGTEFCVGIFDCDGVIFSPTYDMFENTDILVRVALSLACTLSIEELGFDPTVQVLSNQETKELTYQTGKVIHRSAFCLGVVRWPPVVHYWLSDMVLSFVFGSRHTCFFLRVHTASLSHENF